MKGKAMPAVVGLMAIVTGMAPGYAASPEAVSESTELPEVQVMGKRLYEMRQDIIKAEDKFFALFNELNTDDDYDVHCNVEAPTGTRLKQRVCRLQFYEKAQAEEAQALLRGEFAPPADLVAVERGAEYEKKALAVINAHPELRRLVREREALDKKYKATRKERFKGRWILFE
jgi:hypothetical protein